MPSRTNRRRLRLSMTDIFNIVLPLRQPDKRNWNAKAPRSLASELLSSDMGRGVGSKNGAESAREACMGQSCMSRRIETSEARIFRVAGQQEILCRLTCEVTPFRDGLFRSPRRAAGQRTARHSAHRTAENEGAACTSMKSRSLTRAGNEGCGPCQTSARDPSLAIWPSSMGLIV